ncbi:ATP-binding protein [Streptosporangium sp. NPDC051022]|uniref:ATP-binding protein n=1 Tax=Streptosporangium sp. NPDC051022 TaxID=3155752 RepID=UPI00343D033E
MTPRWHGLHWLGAQPLDGVPSSVGAARAWIAIRLGTDVPGVPADTLDTVKLLTSELVTNAITHSRSRDGVLLVRLGVSRPGRTPTIHVEVLDDGSDDEHPVMRMDPDGESGRGLFLVDALSLRWGTADAEPGRVVWFQVPYVPSR